MDNYTSIKNILIDNEINKRVKDYSKELTKDLGKGFNFSSLARMRKFYLLIEKLATVSQHLSYGHYVELLPYSDINKVKYYINIVEKQNLSIRELRKKIKSDEYERIPEKNKKKLKNK